MTELRSSSELIRKLQSIVFKQRLVMFVSGLLLTIAVLALVVIALSLLANVMVLPVWFKISLLIVSGGLALYFFGRYALARLFRGSVDAVALELEQQHEDLKGRLIAAVQFARVKPHPSYSADLLEMTQQQALKRASGINFNEAVSFHGVLKAGRYFLAGTVLAVAMIALFPGLFSYSYEVYSNVTTEVAPPIAYEIVPIPESTEWVKYRDITIGAAIIGQRFPEKAVIHHRLAGGNWQETEIDVQALPKLVYEGGDSAQFAVTLRQVNRSFDFFVQAGRVRTEVQSIDVVDRPRVTGIKLSIFYPDYTKLSPLVIDENNGSFSAVVGSRANVSIATNLLVENAELVFGDSSRLPLTVDGKHATAALLVDQSRSYYVALKDHLGEKNPDPIEFYITAVPDEFPSVEVVRPGFDVNLSDETLLPLLTRIYDDYGFSSLVLKYKVVAQGRPSEENVAVLHFSERIETEGEIEFNWDMEPLNLFPGDYVVYHFEVADNDMISGPKVSKSRQYIARLPSLEEVIAQTESQGRERIVRTEELIKTGRELTERLKKAARKMDAEVQNGNKTDWQQKKELENISQDNAEMVDQIEKTAEQMEKSLEELQKNDLMSRQVLEKLEEIQKLFEEVATPEMREAQQRLMEALKNMDRQEMEQAMKDFEMSQEELLDRLERTLALLKKMQLEQKMDAMIRKAEELVQRQSEMNEKAESSNEEALPQMSSDEDKLEQALQGLKKEVEEFRDLMQQAQMSESQEAQQFAQAVEQTDADRDMQQMSQSMQGQKKDQAVESGEKAESKLTQMLGQMQQQQMAMQSQSSEAIKQAMRRAIDDANYLSKSEEELIKDAASVDPRSLVLRDVARSQQDVKSACNGLQNSIGELGRQSPFIAGELQALVNDALANMDLATEQLENKDGAAAMRSQREAMSMLNKTSVRLMESLDQQNQCDKASNCNKSMSKLEKLCNKQNSLNQETQSQCNNPGSSAGSPREGEGQRAAYERLAGEQGAIRKSVQELAAEFGNSRQILGRLDDIADEMEDIEEALASGDVGEDVAERQLRVLSRMLEASRSLQRRDFSEQRKAATASGQPVYMPPSLTADMLDDRVELEDRLRKFLGSGYPEQYEEQIKAYFRALLKAQSGGSTPAQDGESN